MEFPLIRYLLTIYIPPFSPYFFQKSEDIQLVFLRATALLWLPLVIKKLIKEPKNLTENIKAVTLSNIKSLLQKLLIYIGIFKISREMLLILFSVHPATRPTTCCYTITQPKFVTECIKVDKHSSKKKMFAQALTPK